MKKTLLAVVLLLCLILSVALAACQQEVTLTLYDTDGTTVLHEIKVKKGGTATKPANPTKDNMTFKGWFITPTNAKEFDFTKPLEEDAAAYAQWQSADYQDSRDWVLVGTLTSWKAQEGFHFTKTADKGNEYTLTVDVDLGDEFKCTVLNADGTLDYNNPTGANVGFGLLKDAGENFATGGGLGDSPKNIVCSVAGNYTFTLKTDPENANNELSVKRNGDMIGGNKPTGAITTYHLKGNMVTDWKDFIGSTTTLKQSATDENVYTLEIYLKAGDDVMFASVVTEDEVTTAGKVYIKYVNLDTASKALFEDNNGNMHTKDAGKYSFSYNAESKALTATVDTDFAPEAADYYIDGTFNSALTDWDYSFKTENKLVQDETKDYIYTIEHVHLVEGKEFIIQKFKAGATERGEWGTPGYNGLGNYNFGYLLNAGEDFEPVSKANQNIKINKTSDYKITLNTISGMIVIEDENIPDDAYIYGTMDGGEWATTADWKMTYNETTKVYTITKAFNANISFGIKVCVGTDITNQRAWYNGANASGSFDGFTNEGNFVCTVAGTYTVTLDMSGETPVITITAAAAE